MEVRFARDIVSLKNLIGLKVDDNELQLMIKDARLVLETLRSNEEYREEVEESPTIQFLQALTELAR